MKAVRAISSAMACMVLAGALAPIAYGSDAAQLSASSVDGAPPIAERDAALPRISEAARQAGALGAYRDRQTDEVVVVVSKRGAATFPKDKVTNLGARVRIDSKDIDQLTIDRILDRLVLLRPSLSPDQTYAAYFNPESGTVDVATLAPEGSFSSLATEFTGRVTVRTVAVSLDGRLNDSPPFWGGARVEGVGRAGDGVYDCTTGFAVWRSGVKYMTTAGHCFAPGYSVWTPASFLTQLGVVQTNSYPTIDLSLIAVASNGGAEGRIYADPGDTYLNVKGTATPVYNSSIYCSSGSYSLKICGWRLYSNDTILCDGDGCRTHLYLFVHDNDGVHTVNGDSGGPVYMQPAAGQAKAVGIMLGGTKDNCFSCLMFVEPWAKFSTAYPGITGVVTQ